MNKENYVKVEAALSIFTILLLPILLRRLLPILHLLRRISFHFTSPYRANVTLPRRGLKIYVRQVS